MTENKKFTFDEVYRIVNEGFTNYYVATHKEMSLSERLLFESIKTFIKTTIEVELGVLNE